MTALANLRFVRMEHPKDEKPDDSTWWQDTQRPLSAEAEAAAGYRYMAVQVEAGKDPNNYRPIFGEMRLLFTDECEYCVVCDKCYETYHGMQWSGRTRSNRCDWKKEAEHYRLDHQRLKGWCEFCDPIFGNGGWIP